MFSRNCDKRWNRQVFHFNKCYILLLLVISLSRPVSFVLLLSPKFLISPSAPWLAPTVELYTVKDILENISTPIFLHTIAAKYWISSPCSRKLVPIFHFQVLAENFCTSIHYQDSFWVVYKTQFGTAL